MGLCSSAIELDKVQQNELLTGKHILEFIDVKWDSHEAKHLLDPFDKAVNNSRGIANVKRLITEGLELPFEKYYYEGFLVFGNCSQALSTAIPYMSELADAAVGDALGTLLVLDSAI